MVGSSDILLWGHVEGCVDPQQEKPREVTYIPRTTLLHFL